jgi:hypothetical protein
VRVDSAVAATTFLTELIEPDPGGSVLRRLVTFGEASAVAPGVNIVEQPERGKRVPPGGQLLPLNDGACAVLLATVCPQPPADPDCQTHGGENHQPPHLFFLQVYQ